MKRTLDLNHSGLQEFDVEIPPEERSYILRHAVWLALEEGMSLEDEVRRPENSGDPYCLIYAALCNTEDFKQESAHRRTLRSLIRKPRIREVLLGWRRTCFTLASLDPRQPFVEFEPT